MAADVLNPFTPITEVVITRRLEKPIEVGSGTILNPLGDSLTIGRPPTYYDPSRRNGYPDVVITPRNPRFPSTALILTNSGDHQPWTAALPMAPDDEPALLLYQPSISSFNLLTPRGKSLNPRFQTFYNGTHDLQAYIHEGSTSLPIYPGDVVVAGQFDRSLHVPAPDGLFNIINMKIQGDNPVFLRAAISLQYTQDNQGRARFVLI